MAPITNGPLKAESIHTLHGANYFSWDPVVVLRLNLGPYDEVFTNQIPGFIEKLKTAVPSLIEHKCSEAVRGGFFLRMEMGTLLGHVLEHVALELQNLAGIDVAFGKTRSTATQGVYNVVFRYEDPSVGIRAGEIAFDLLNSLLTDQHYNLSNRMEELRVLRSKQMSSSARELMALATERSIPVRRMATMPSLLLGSGKHSAVFPILGDTGKSPEEFLKNHFPLGSPHHVPLYGITGAKGVGSCLGLLYQALSLSGTCVTAKSSSPEAMDQMMSHALADSHLIPITLEQLVFEGLPYRTADTGIVLNSAEQLPVHEDMTDPEDIAYTLAVVAEEVDRAGVAVLNADDPHVLAMAKRLYARPVFFTKERNLRFVSEHITAGNLAIVLQDDLVTLEQYRNAEPILKLSELSPTCEHVLEDTVDALLGAAAALAGNGWSAWEIREAFCSRPKK